MEFELDFSQPVRDVGGLRGGGGGGHGDAADEDAPAVGVVGGCVFGAVGGVEGDGFGAEDEGAVDLYAAEAFGGGGGGHVGWEGVVCEVVWREECVWL